MTLLLLLLLFSGVLIRKIWPKWDSAWYRLGSLLYARCVTGSTKFGALYYSLSTVSNCRFFEIPLKLSNGCKSMDNFSLVDSTQFNCNALLCLLILRSSIAKLFFVRWFYAVRSQSSFLLEVWQNPRNLAHSTILRVWVSGFNRHLDSLQYQCFYDCPMSKGIWCIHCIFCIRCIRFEGPRKLVWLLSLTAWSLKSRLPGCW